jgi:hypothetical protein
MKIPDVRQGHILGGLRFNAADNYHKINRMRRRDLPIGENWAAYTTD